MQPYNVSNYEEQDSSTNVSFVSSQLIASAAAAYLQPEMLQYAATYVGNKVLYPLMQNVKDIWGKLPSLPTLIPGADASEINQTPIRVKNVNRRQIISTTDSMIPVGSVMAFASENLPANYLECNGQVLQVTDYPELFAEIGRLYTADDIDQSHFALPDYRGMILRHRDGGKGADPDADDRLNSGNGTVGDTVGTWQDWALIYHTHRMSPVVRSQHPSCRTGNNNRYHIIPYGTSDFCYTVGVREHNVQGSTENRMKNVNVQYAMRVRPYVDENRIRQDARINAQADQIASLQSSSENQSLSISEIENRITTQGNDIYSNGQLLAVFHSNLNIITATQARHEQQLSNVINNTQQISEQLSNHSATLSRNLEIDNAQDDAIEILQNDVQQISETQMQHDQQLSNVINNTQQIAEQLSNHSATLSRNLEKDNMQDDAIETLQEEVNVLKAVSPSEAPDQANTDINSRLIAMSKEVNKANENASTATTIAAVSMVVSIGSSLAACGLFRSKTKENKMLVGEAFPSQFTTHGIQNTVSDEVYMNVEPETNSDNSQEIRVATSKM